MPSEEPLHSPASFIIIIPIAGIHFAYILVVARSGKPLASFAIVKNSLIVIRVCIMKFGIVSYIMTNCMHYYMGQL